MPGLSTVFLPDDMTRLDAGKLPMNKTERELFQARLLALVEISGLSDMEISKRAGASGDLIRNVKRKGTIPNALTLERLADVLNTSTAYLTGKTNDTRRQTPSTVRAADATMAFHERPLPRDVPVYGTALGGQLDGLETEIISGDVIEYLPRPPRLAQRRDIYALYIAGTSMQPKWHPGDLIYVDPARPARQGDDVIVQLADIDGRRIGGLIKTLVKIDGSAATVMQYNPEAQITIPRAEIAAIHRVLRTQDLLGF